MREVMLTNVLYGVACQVHQLRARLRLPPLRMWKPEWLPGRKSKAWKRMPTYKNGTLITGSLDQTYNRSGHPFGQW